MTLNLQKRRGKNGRFGHFIITVRLITSWWLRIFWSRACLLLGLLVNVNISAYLSGSSLIALGMSWWEATIAIIAGNIIANILVVLNSLPGAYYHVGFPVVNRSVWGMWGTQFVIWNRIFLSIIWCTSIPSLTFYYLFSWKKIYWYCCDSWIPGLDRWWMRLHMSQGHMAFDRGADTKSHGSVHRCHNRPILGIYYFYGHFNVLHLHTTTQTADPTLCFCHNCHGVHGGSVNLVNGHYGPTGIRWDHNRVRRPHQRLGHCFWDR